MSKFRYLWFILFIMLILSPSIATFANDGVLGTTPEGVYPITQSDIMMRSEEITIHMLNYSDAKVSLRFDFENYGDAQTVLIGFPARLNEELFIAQLIFVVFGFIHVINLLNLKDYCTHY